MCKGSMVQNVLVVIDGLEEACVARAWLVTEPVDVGRSQVVKGLVGH